MIARCETCGNEFTKKQKNQYCCSKSCNAKRWHEANKKLKEPSKLTCKHCGNAFGTTYSKKCFCSKDCNYQYGLAKKKGKSYRTITHNCNNCGKEFVYEYTGYYRYYCDASCSIEAKRLNNKANVISSEKSIKAKCPKCGKEHNNFTNYTGTGTPRIYCVSCLKAIRYYYVDFEFHEERRYAVC